MRISHINPEPNTESREPEKSLSAETPRREVCHSGAVSSGCCNARAQDFKDLKNLAVKDTL